MQVKNFEDLEIWKDARTLARKIYQLTKDSKFSKDFVLRDQFRRAAVSIMSNIAEGFERGAIKNSLNFFISQKVPAVKCVHNSMRQLTKDISHQRNRKNY